MSSSADVTIDVDRPVSESHATATAGSGWLVVESIRALRLLGTIWLKLLHINKIYT